MTKNEENYNKILLIKGPAGSGKTKMLQNKYQELVNEGISTNQILVLLRNRRQTILWRDIINFDTASSIKIQSYFGFIQGEIKKYWPMISSKIKGLKTGMTEPVFLTTEISQYLLTKLVEDFRKKGKLLDVTASSQKIAIETLGNLSRAVTSGIGIDVIGARLFKSSGYKNNSRERLYSEIQELINKYENDCMENGYIDYALSLEIYSTYLLKDNSYLERLNKEIQYLIVDGIEDAVPCEADFINLIVGNGGKAVIAFSTDDSYSRRQGACPEYINDLITAKCAEIIHVEKSAICTEDLMAFSETLSNRLMQLAEEDENNKNIDTEKLGKNVIRIQAELRSEMIEKICLEIRDLLEKGIPPHEIAVISPMVDSILEYTLKSCFEKKQIGVTNIARTAKYLDESFSRALVTLACLCHPGWDFNPPEHDIANLIGMVLGLDPVRSSLISSEVIKLKPFSLPDLDKLEFRERIGFKNSDRYNMLKNWIENYRAAEPIDIDSFFQNAFITIMLRVPQVEYHVNACGLLIESAASFVKAMKSFSHDDLGKAFVEMIKQGVKPAETIQDLEKKLYCKDLVVATPQSYLASSLNKKVQIWTDISSPLWYRSDVEELANPYVFAPIWKDEEEWAEELDEKYRMLKCGVLLRNTIRRCSNTIIFAESDYSQDGYENDGVIPEILEELII